MGGMRGGRPPGSRNTTPARGLPAAHHPPRAALSRRPPAALPPDAREHWSALIDSHPWLTIADAAAAQQYALAAAELHTARRAWEIDMRAGRIKESAQVFAMLDAARKKILDIEHALGGTPLARKRLGLGAVTAPERTPAERAREAYIINA